MKIFLAGTKGFSGIIAETLFNGDGSVFIHKGSKYTVKLYMAGGITANLNSFWKKLSNNITNGGDLKAATEDAMELFLAGGESRHWLHDEMMSKKK